LYSDWKTEAVVSPLPLFFLPNVPLGLGIKNIDMPVCGRKRENATKMGYII